MAKLITEELVKLSKRQIVEETAVSNQVSQATVSGKSVNIKINGRLYSFIPADIVERPEEIAREFNKLLNNKGEETALRYIVNDTIPKTDITRDRVLKPLIEESAEQLAGEIWEIRNKHKWGLQGASTKAQWVTKKINGAGAVKAASLKELKAELADLKKREKEVLNEETTYEIYEYKRIGNDKAIQHTYTGFKNFASAMNHRIKLNTPANKKKGLGYAIIKVDGNKREVSDDTDFYTTDYIRNHFKGSTQAVKETVDSNINAGVPLREEVKGKKSVSEWDILQMIRAYINKEFGSSNVVYQSIKSGAKFKINDQNLFEITVKKTK